MFKLGMKAVIGLSIISGAVFFSPSVGATDGSGCVNPQGRYSMNVQWTSNSQVIVSTKDKKPVCKDVNLTFSSYTLPANYNGMGFFNNVTSTPQQLFDSVSFVILASTATSAQQIITLPESCKAHQVDVYYGAPVSVVIQPGFGRDLVDGHIVKKKGECAVVTPPIEPTTAVKPVVSTQPVVPVEPINMVNEAPLAMPTPETKTATPVTSLPSELPKTGGGIVSSIVLTVILSAATYGATFAITNRR